MVLKIIKAETSQLSLLRVINRRVIKCSINQFHLIRSRKRMNKKICVIVNFLLPTMWIVDEKDSPHTQPDGE